MFNVEVRTRCEAIAISPKAKTVDLRDVATGAVTTERYDKLVLSPGAGADPAAAARHRPAGDLLGAHRARRADHPPVAAPRRGSPIRHGLVHGVSRS